MDFLIVDKHLPPHQIDPQVAWTVPIGKGAQDVRVLPRSAAWAAGRRDVVPAVSVDEGLLTIYDDETGSVATFRQDQATGAPVLGHQPFGLAVDPEPAGTTARLWIGSYRDGFVTPIDVALDAPEVEAVLSVGRRPCGMQHPKLRELVIADLFDATGVESQLVGYDACLWAVGVSSVGSTMSYSMA